MRRALIAALSCGIICGMSLALSGTAASAEFSPFQTPAVAAATGNKTVIRIACVYATILCSTDLQLEGCPEEPYGYRARVATELALEAINNASISGSGSSSLPPLLPEHTLVLEHVETKSRPSVAMKNLVTLMTDPAKRDQLRAIIGPGKGF